MQQRRAGVLLHPTSLPGGVYNGELDKTAYQFIDFLHVAGQSIWQLLPLGPTHADGSPYQSLSVYAGNPILIDLHPLVEQGLLEPAQIQTQLSNVNDPVLFKRELIAKAYERLLEGADANRQQAFQDFVKQQSWVTDFALYVVLKDLHQHRSWVDWPVEIRNRDASALLEVTKANEARLNVIKFEQFLFYQQWTALKKYANEKGVLVFGDVPIFVAHDSAEVWVNPELFRLDHNGQPSVVAGVPPDYFSKTGQRWGNPLYDWNAMASDGYAWWARRLKYQLHLFDWVRIDHFRGFEAYWVIDAHEKTAMNGRWEKGPCAAFFQAMQNELGGELPLVAEDLGFITKEVHELRTQFNLPGMKILQFAFDGGPTNPYLPHNHAQDSVVYTGTHDNDTSLGWFAQLSESQRQNLYGYYGESKEAMPWLLIRSALASVANAAIVPMQDLLELDGLHRMNTPGTSTGNWRWRFHWGQLKSGLAQRVREMTERYGRI